jgi:hypothetical protein
MNQTTQKPHKKTQKNIFFIIYSFYILIFITCVHLLGHSCAKPPIEIKKKLGAGATKEQKMQEEAQY